MWGETVPRIASALREIGSKPVTLQINSPGGDAFEGVAAFNLLRAHPADVTVQILGLAASAASIIAMAGDQIEIARNASLMIHDASGIVVGNKTNMREFASILDQLDAALAGTYAARTGLPVNTIASWMGTEKWINAEAAVSCRIFLVGYANCESGSPDSQRVSV